MCLSSYIYFCIAVSHSKYMSSEAIQSIIHQALVEYLTVLGTGNPGGSKSPVQGIHKQVVKIQHCKF